MNYKLGKKIEIKFFSSVKHGDELIKGIVGQAKRKMGEQRAIVYSNEYETDIERRKAANRLSEQKRGNVDQMIFRTTIMRLSI